MGETRIFERMRSDHRDVLERIRSLDGAASEEKPRPVGPDWPGAEVLETLDMLERQFATHMAAEDEVLFPALIEALPQTRFSVEPLQADHVELRTMLRRVQDTVAEKPSAGRNEQIAIQLRDFVDLLQIHIRKEEAIVISVAERVLRPREVEALADRMAREQGARPTRRSGTGASKGASE